jgi:nitroreductase
MGYHQCAMGIKIKGLIMDVTNAIRTKQAVRLFEDKPVPEEIILQILDAGRRSQSSKNTQPWQFIAVRDRETLKALSKTGDYAGHLAGAAFAIILLGTDQRNWNMFDLGQAAAYLQLAAWELGVGSCLASIYHPDQARAILGVPDTLECNVALSFGYPSPDHKAAQMGGRRPIDDVVMWDKWQEK